MTPLPAVERAALEDLLQKWREREYAPHCAGEKAVGIGWCADDLETLLSASLSTTIAPVAWRHKVRDGLYAYGADKEYWTVAGIEPEPLYASPPVAIGAEQAAREAPFCWVIPGDDTANMNGFIDARITEEGEFTKPLYERPQVSHDWVPCSERMPDGPQQVLVVVQFQLDKKSWVEAASFQNAPGIAPFWFTSLHDNLPLGNITHWKPLPAAPKK